MQKARIRTAWRNKQKTVSLEEVGVAAAAVIWRVALNAAKNLHDQDYAYDNDEQRLGVMQEYLYFLIHIADRLADKHFNTKQREIFVTALAQECQRHIQQNCREILGSGAAANDFMSQLNDRSSAYAQTQFPGFEPGHECLRLFGYHIQQLMGESQTNKWVMDQITQIDAPEASEITIKALRKLLQSNISQEV